MAELTVFRYRSGTSPLYTLDVRVKMASLVLISLTSVQMRPLGLCALTCLILLLMRSARISFSALFKELRVFLVLLAVIFFARGCTLSGSPLLGLRAVSISPDGFYVGALICWRLLVVVLMGISFAATTRTHQVKAGLEWIFKPVPLIPGKRVATMIALLMRFVPVILHQAKETVDAQRARGIEKRKNPFYRMRKLVSPLLRRTFQDADKLVVAMEARCYSEIRTDPRLDASRKDWMVLSAVAGGCFLLIIL